MTGEDGKAGWRARLLADRLRLGSVELAVAAGALRRHVLDRLAGAGRIAAYVPVGREPGSLALLDGLRDAGTEVLLPLVVGDELHWAVYSGPDGLEPGPFRTVAPGGDRLGPRAVGGVDAVLVPALAVDRLGSRLGRGGGYYDRALRLAPAGIPVAALLHDGELVPRLPTDAWDRPVTAAVTPRTGWTGLPVVEHHGS